MRLLIDTQVLLWSLCQPKKLLPALRTRLIDSANQVFFSSVSIAEIAIKSSLGRNDFSFQAEEVTAAALQTGFIELPLDSRQAMRVAGLPWHHRDPFDRLMIAQAIEDGLRFVTADNLLLRYTDLVECVA